jgi:putative oxidoreductase
MALIEKFGPLLGRILIAAMFIPAGVSKIGGFAGTVGYITSKGLPMPEVGAAIAIVVEIAAGLALLVGFKARYAALVLALFTLAASVFFHNFWAVPEAQKMVQQLMFMKNLSVVGGLLFIAAFGAGPLSLDSRRN